LTATSYPARASASTALRPMPVAAPVTSAAFLEAEGVDASGVLD